jgi:hypothetical protein
MSTIAGKEWYRNVFLNSDEWKEFRLEKLKDHNGKCLICRKRDVSNDVHHIWYGEESVCGYPQFAVLCRCCHDAVHSLFEPRSAKSESEKKECYGNFLIAKERIIFEIHRIGKKSKPAKPLFCACCLKVGLELKAIDLARMDKNPVFQSTWVCSNCEIILSRTIGYDPAIPKSLVWKKIKLCFEMVRTGLTLEQIQNEHLTNTLPVIS